MKKISLALLASLLFASPSLAKCERHQRIAYRDVPCLNAKVVNHWWLKNRYEFQNLCSDHGKIVIKVDLRHAKDKHITISGGGKGKGYSDHHIRSLTCCTDLSSSGMCERERD